MFGSWSGFFVKVQFGHKRVTAGDERDVRTQPCSDGRGDLTVRGGGSVPAGRGRTGQAAVSRLCSLRAEGVGADGGDGSPHQPAPGGDVDVHLRGSQEGFAWRRQKRRLRGRKIDGNRAEFNRRSSCAQPADHLTLLFGENLLLSLQPRPPLNDGVEKRHLSGTSSRDLKKTLEELGNGR